MQTQQHPAPSSISDPPVLSDGDFASTDFGRSHRARTTVADAIAVYEGEIRRQADGEVA